MKIPKLLFAESTVCICAGCKKWLGRFVDFEGEHFGKGDYCDRCRCTSHNQRPGRPFGPKSKKWKLILEAWEEYWDWMPAGELIGIVKTYPSIEIVEKEREKENQEA